MPQLNLSWWMIKFLLTWIAIFIMSSMLINTKITKPKKNILNINKKKKKKWLWI